jgi:hypothetical protein
MPAIGLFLALALPLAAPARADVAPCLWSAMPPFKEKVLSAPDLRAFDQLRREYSDADWTSAFTRCGLDEEKDAGAAGPLAYYEASLWAERRLVAKWPAATLEAAVAAIPEKDLQYFWRQPPAESRPADYDRRRAKALARLYGPFGRSGPAQPLDDLDIFVTSRVGWRLGEIDYRKARAAPAAAGVPGG